MKKMYYVVSLVKWCIYGIAGCLVGEAIVRILSL
jgi:hypothetical protein